jgi:hypothetical protein
LCYLFLEVQLGRLCPNWFCSEDSFESYLGRWQNTPHTLLEGFPFKSVHIFETWDRELLSRQLALPVTSIEEGRYLP